MRRSRCCDSRPGPAPTGVRVGDWSRPRGIPPLRAGEARRPGAGRVDRRSRRSSRGAWRSDVSRASARANYHQLALCGKSQLLDHRSPMTQTMRLPRKTRLFLAGNTISMVGTGLVLPFMLIYLHQVRGIALPVVGAILGGAAVAGLAVVPISGVLVDRIGARPVLIGIMVGQAIADVWLASAQSALTALPAMLLYGATWAPMFPTLATMIAGLTPQPVTQQRAFAINFTAQNAALGIGAAVDRKSTRLNS